MKSALISGASRGIGAETARKFASEGYNVMINYNDSEREAIALREQILSDFPNISAEIYKCDVSKYDECEKMMKYFLSIFGKIDVLICNAGISLIKPLIDTSLEDYKQIMDTNFGGAFYLAKLAYEPMIRENYGNIIFISSMWGSLGASCESVYSASKGAMEAFSKSLKKELEFTNINVETFAPGFVETDMNSHLSKKEREEVIENCPIGRAETSAEVAKKIFKLVK